MGKDPMFQILSRRGLLGSRPDRVGGGGDDDEGGGCVFQVAGATLSSLLPNKRVVSEDVTAAEIAVVHATVLSSSSAVVWF